MANRKRKVVVLSVSMVKLALRSVLFAAAVGMVRGQSPAPAFEAAAIKADHSGRLGGGLNLSPTRVRILNSSLKFCVQMAWDVKEYQVAGGAGWMETEHYNIDAVAAAPFKKDEFRAMLQTLLAERFGLEVHRETKEARGYALIAGRGGAKLPPPLDDPSVLFSRTPTGDVTLTAPSVTMQQLAWSLSSRLGVPIVDQTGIDGHFNVFLQYTPDPNSEPAIGKSGEPLPPRPADAPPGPTLFGALQDRLGLKLETRKVPVEVIVIDRANRPTDN